MNSGSFKKNVTDKRFANKSLYIYIYIHTHKNTSVNNDSWILYNLNKWRLTFSCFLSFLCCCQCRFKRYIAKQMNSKTEETVPLWCQPAFLTTCLLSLPFSFNVASHKSHDSFFLSFFFTFPFFKDYKKMSELSSSFFLSFSNFVLSFFTLIFTFFID